MPLAQSKREFFHKGVDNQKRPDIVIDLRRVSPDKIKEWSLSQRLMALAFIRDARNTFNAFEKEIKDAAQ